uniref:Ribonuclease H-like domain-containing protein n=1 Tax=Tanacetum cinerariifolium TaxID=118510 RepID=A0A6L2LZ72_TANCI|nr:ribonuclease H-like domain-containing protein [Tanacetum cinerariifolium]
MSMMGELEFFLGIKIHQSSRDIFINQAKYAQEILIKLGMTSCNSIGTPMATKHLDADLSGTPVDQTKYHSMVRALMYLTASRPDIVHATCYCARHQARPTEKHVTAFKRIFRFLKNTINMGLWYPKEPGFELTTFLDSDHAGCLDSQKCTSGGIQFLGGDKLVSWSSKKQECTLISSAEVDNDGYPSRVNIKQLCGRAPRKSKAQRFSGSSSATFGSSKAQIIELMQQQIFLDREAKKELMDRKLAARLAVCEIQKGNEDLKILTFDTTGMNPEDAAKIDALKDKTRATYFNF